jgi:hypothetical protein
MSAAKPFPLHRSFLAAVLAAITLALLAGCSVQEGRTASGEKKVDIRTPFADVKVNTEVDAKDTGLPVYPGAQRVTGTDSDKHAANVNISSGEFGLKVVAIKFQSDDPPQKVVEFYRDKMKVFGGKFVECEKQKGFVTYSGRGDENELNCSKGGSGDSVELKAGTPERQHIVAVKPYGSGSEFALVYVQKHGKEGAL